MTDDEMFELFDELQPLCESRLSELEYAVVESLYDGGELEAAILAGLCSAAAENVAIDMELVRRAAPMYTAGSDQIRYADAVTRLAEIEVGAGM